MEKSKVGVITHYFNDISVGVIELSGKLTTEDTISIEGAHTNFEQEVGSMEIDNESVDQASAGKKVAIKVESRVREGDDVYKID